LRRQESLDEIRIVKGAGVSHYSSSSSPFRGNRVVPMSCLLRATRRRLILAIPVVANAPLERAAILDLLV
jgi:hypothetical protein